MNKAILIGNISPEEQRDRRKEHVVAFKSSLPALDHQHLALLHPVVRETLDETRKGDSFRLATIADGFDDVRSGIGQSEDARDVGRGQTQLLRKVAQVGRLSHGQTIRPPPGIVDGVDRREK